jgi:hypothetical protein
MMFVHHSHGPFLCCQEIQEQNWGNTHEQARNGRVNHCQETQEQIREIQEQAFVIGMLSFTTQRSADGLAVISAKKRASAQFGPVAGTDIFALIPITQTQQPCHLITPNLTSR